MAKLYLLREGELPAEAWEIGTRPLAVGRGATADVRIEDDGLSRRHFMICLEGSEYVLRDLSSRNGTWVAGERTAQIALKHNDQIVAGRTTFRFCDQALEPSTGPNGTLILARASP